MLREIEEHNVNRGNKCNQPYDTIELQMIVFTAKKVGFIKILGQSSGQGQNPFLF